MWEVCQVERVGLGKKQFRAQAEVGPWYKEEDYDQKHEEHWLYLGAG